MTNFSNNVDQTIMCRVVNWLPMPMCEHSLNYRLPYTTSTVDKVITVVMKDNVAIEVVAE